MRLIFTLLIAVFLGKTLPAQVSVKARVDSTHLLIGDQLKLHIEVEQPAGAVVHAPDVQAMKDSVIEFLAQGKWDTLAKGNRLQLRKDLVFTAWDTGYQRLPALPLAWEQGGVTDTVFIKEIPLQVGSPARDTILADIKPIIAEPSTWRDFLPETGIILALLIIIWLVIVARRRKKAPPLAPAPVARLLPHEIALQKLEALKKERRWQQGQVKEYHSELTHILREYLENRFNVAALEETTDEILGQMQRLRFDEKLSDDLRQMLQMVDLVKFAKAQPPSEFHEEAMAYVERFIKTTKMTETP